MYVERFTFCYSLAVPSQLARIFAVSRIQGRFSCRLFMVTWHEILYLTFFLLQVDKVLTLDLGGTSDHWTYDKLLELHDLGDKLLPIPARLQATISTVSKLEELSRKFAAAQRDVDAGFMGLANDAAYYKTRLEGLISGGVILGKKVKDVLDMVRFHNCRT